MDDAAPPALAALGATDRRQVEGLLAALHDVIDDEVVSAYLHGSAVLDGLGPLSDIDVLAVTKRRTTRKEKEALIARLLDVSGRASERPRRRPLELTVVVWPEIRPWSYPPTMDLQYGEWWRAEFERGELEPWGSRTNPDVTLLLCMVLQGNATLVGPPAAAVLDRVPRDDFTKALIAGLDELVPGVEDDTRNVVLTLARIWKGVESGEVSSKGAAASWALDRLPSEFRPVLQRALDVYRGTTPEQWNDLRAQLRPFVDEVIHRIKDAASERRNG